MSSCLFKRKVDNEIHPDTLPAPRPNAWHFSNSFLNMRAFTKWHFQASFQKPPPVIQKKKKLMPRCRCRQFRKENLKECDHQLSKRQTPKQINCPTSIMENNPDNSASPWDLKHATSEYGQIRRMQPTGM